MTEAKPMPHETPADPATDPTAIGPPPAGAEVAPDGTVTAGLPADAAEAAVRDGAPAGE